jgi:hypothetical protein
VEITPPPSAPPAPREDIETPSAGIRGSAYDDETVAANNYYEEEDDEYLQLSKTCKNAQDQGAAQSQAKKARLNRAEDEDAALVRGSFKTDPDGYYLAVKEEIDRLFKTYPCDKTLNGAFSCSDWVRVKGTAKEPQYLVGVLKTDGRVNYICYALAAEDKENPPEEIKNVCAFVPTSPYDETKGFFVIFQSAASGECVRPERT